MSENEFSIVKVKVAKGYEDAISAGLKHMGVDIEPISTEDDWVILSLSIVATNKDLRDRYLSTFSSQFVEVIED